MTQAAAHRALGADDEAQYRSDTARMNPLSGPTPLPQSAAPSRREPPPAAIVANTPVDGDNFVRRSFLTRVGLGAAGAGVGAAGMAVLFNAVLIMTGAPINLSCALLAFLPPAGAVIGAVLGPLGMVDEKYDRKRFEG